MQRKSVPLEYDHCPDICSSYIHHVERTTALRTYRLINDGKFLQPVLEKVVVAFLRTRFLFLLVVQGFIRITKLCRVVLVVRSWLRETVPVYRGPLFFVSGHVLDFDPVVWTPW